MWWGSAPPGFDPTKAYRDQIQRADLTAVTLRREYGRGFSAQILRSGLVSIGLPEQPDLEMTELIARNPDTAFDDALEAKAGHIQYLNALSSCLYSGLLAVSELDINPVLISAENALTIRFEQAGQFFGAGGPGAGDVDEMFRNPMRAGVVDLEALELGFSLFGDLLNKDTSDAISLVALLNEAICAYKVHNFPLAVVAAWSICERLQSLAWAEYCGEAERNDRIRLNKDRRKNLSKGRDFTAAVVATVLQMAGVLDVNLGEKLQKARSARNNWLHAGARPNRERAWECIEAAVAMCDKVINFSLDVGSSISVSM